MQLTWSKCPRSRSDSPEARGCLLQAHMLLVYELPPPYALLSSVAQVCSIKRQGVYELKSGQSYLITSEQLTEGETG